MSSLDQVFVATFLLLTMFGMGATLSVESFRSVARRPAPLLVGLVSQFGWMPLIAYALARGFSLSDPLAIGLIVLGSSSGGTTSNLFTYYARADLALSISMTVMSTLAAVALMPLVLWVYATPFQNPDLSIPYDNILITLFAVLVPVVLGVTLRTLRPEWAVYAERIGSSAGLLVLAGVVASSLYRDSERILGFTLTEVGIALLLGPLGFAFGYLGARALGVASPQRRAISLETGIQNVPLALGIIIASFSGALEQEILRIPLLYGVLVVPVSALLAWVFRPEAAEAALA